MNTNDSSPHHCWAGFIRNLAVILVSAMMFLGCALGDASGMSSPLPAERWPGRVVVDDKTLDDFVAIKEEASPAPAWTLRVFQSTSVPELQIRAQWRTIGAVTEWIPTLVNNAPKPSGKVTQVRSLAASWPTRGPVDFYGTNGSASEAHDFIDRTELDIDTIELMPEGGRSSDGIFPFFAFTDRHDALAIGIGWSGRWSASLRHAEGRLQVEVGLPQVGFILRPWESVRLPSVLLARAPEAGAEQARRVVRAHLAQHVIPLSPEGKSLNFTAHDTFYEYVKTRTGGEQRELEALERAAEMGFETYWVEASWYGNEPIWFQEVGNWNIRRSDFPRGLRPISERAHALGMKFVFWMEPERAKPHTAWARKYPDLFLTYPKEVSPRPWHKDSILLNLADPRAVDLAFTTVSALISEFNADIYRNDFNTWPLTAWYAADAPDRVGITEIRYIEGLYALWDRILDAHPGVVIDNVAAGGRRIDLETLRRSILLWPSDHQMNLKPEELPKIDIVNQIHGWGLGHWVADKMAIIKTFDAYAIRSTLATGFIAYRALPADEDPEYADAIAALAENKRLRPFIMAERIDLITPDLEKEAWAAYQHHRHVDASGIIVALRGPGAQAQDSVTLRPEHIDARATYQVTKWDDYQALPATKMLGTALKELAVTIAKTRSSVLVEYQRVAG